ncbi:MAG: hypothetical protein V2A74_15415 [bacterium]
MKRISIFAVVLLLLHAVSYAQDLDTTTVSDQFNSGLRGNATGSLTFGAPAVDGTEFADITNVNGVTGTIRYINGFAGASAGDAGHGESPVVDCTVVQDNPDHDIAATIPAIAANTRPGATSPAMVLFLGDDGGWNGIFLGESDDANYYIQVDAYCYNRSALGLGQYESIMVNARAARNSDPNMTDVSFNLDRAGSYCLMFDPMTTKVQALKWNFGQSYSSITARTASNYTEYGTVTNVAEGWHTFRIECLNTGIKFIFDGSTVADVTDSTYTNGRPGFGYRESLVLNPDERQGHFDNLQAGPTAVSSLAVKEWALFE